jgi:hypothetical protein
LPQTGPQEGPAIFLTGCEKEEPQLIPAPPPKVVSTCSDITKCQKKNPKRKRMSLYRLKFSGF